MGAFTLTQYQRLTGMISKGVTSLDLGNGERVTYRSLDEMLRLKAVMERDLGLLPPTRVHYPTVVRGVHG